jgi:hypothetical protein
VKVPTDEGDEAQEFKIKAGVRMKVSTNLSKRFGKAFTAPCCKIKLFDNIGFI